MQEQDADGRWVTVQLRNRFGLPRYQGNTSSGFLRRAESGTFGHCPLNVTKIHQTKGRYNSDHPKCWYLEKRKTMSVATIPGIINQTRIQSCPLQSN
jgi:hypothetical protein